MDNHLGMDRKAEGTIFVYDPSPFNWLYVLFNTMEEAVRADHEGRIVPSLATQMRWINETSLEMSLRKNVVFHDGLGYPTWQCHCTFL
jgi:ABC-type transport system substrate-binding protein